MAEQLDTQAAVVSPVSVQEFSKKVKEKYPEYKDVDDATLAKKIVNKYPEYKDKVSFDQPEPNIPGSEQATEPASLATVSKTQPEQPLTFMQKELRQKFPENYTDEVPQPIQQPVKPLGKVDQLKVDYFRKTRGDEFADQEQAKMQEPGKPEEDGFAVKLGKTAGSSFMTGMNKLNSWVADAPGFIYDLAGAPFRAVGLEVPTSQDFKDSPLQNISSFYKDNAKAYEKKVQEANPSRGSGIIASFENGDIEGGFLNLAGSISESAPASIAMMLSGGATVPTILGSATVFGAAKAQEMDENAPEMDYDKRRVIAALNGTLEGIFETYLGSGAVGKSLAGIIKNEGKEAAKETAKRSLSTVFADMITKNPWMAPLGEGFEEIGTQISQNLVDKYSGYKPELNIMDGVGDSFLSGIGMGSIHGAAIGLAKSAMDTRNATPITTATIEGQQYTINNPEDIGQEGKPIFAKDAEGNVTAVQNHKVENPVTQTLGEINQANQQAAEQAKLYEGIADPNAQVTDDIQEGDIRLVKFSNGQSKIITPEGEIVANNQQEEDRILEAVVNGEPLPQPKVTDTGEVIQPAPERKIVTQKFGNTPIDIIEGEEYDEIVPTEKVPLEKALPVLEKKFKDNEDFELQVEKVQVEEPGETKYDKPVKKTVIKSIRIVPKQSVESQEAEQKKQIDQQNQVHNKVVNMVNDFNSLSDAGRRKANTADIVRMASELGYNVKTDNSGKLIVTDKGKQIGLRGRQKSAEEIQSHPTLTDYSPEIQETAGYFLNPMSIQDVDLAGIPPLQAKQAILDIQAGKKTVAANDFLDAIENIYNTGIVSFKANRQTGLPGAEIPLEEYMALMNEEDPAAENMSDEQADFILSLTEDELLTPEILNQLYYEITGQETTGIAPIETGINEAEVSEKRNLKNEVSENISRTSEQDIANQQIDNLAIEESLQKNQLQNENKKNISERLKNVWSKIYSENKNRGIFDDGFISTGFNEAIPYGSDNLASHGMAKSGLGSALSDLISLFENGIDINRRGGLDVAPLTNSSKAQYGTTGGGTSYRDGAFILVGKKGHSGKFTNINQIGGILVNDGVVNADPQIIDLLREYFPNLLIESFNNASELTQQLNQNEESENVNREVAGSTQETENISQAEQGQGIEEGLEQNVEQKLSLLNVSDKAAQDIEGRPNLVKTLDKISSELGEPVNIINSEEIPPSVNELKKQIKEGNRVPAFFLNGQVYILSDQIQSVSDAVSSYVHETIIHKGLRNTFAQADKTSIIGKQYAKLDDLLIDVFGSMSRSQKMQIANYYAPGLYENGRLMRNPTNEEKALIGEEFLAHISENPEIYDAPVLSKWKEWINRLAQIIRKAFRLTSNQFSQNDLLDIIREQRRRMREQGKKDVSNEIRLKVSDNPEENNLIAVHNIKPAGLLNANRLGGLPMPSLAIVDINNGFDKYGDITLIADKDFIDPKKNRHSKVFASDVYSARYPNINYQIPRSGENKIVNKVNSLFDDKSLASDISHHIKSEIEDGGLRSLSRDQYAQLLFLADTKQPVEIKYSESKVSDDVKQAFKDNGWLGLMYHEIHENNQVKKQLTDLYMKKYESDPDLMEVAKERFVDEDGILNGNLLRNFIRDVQDDVQRSGKIDTYATVRAADDYIRNNNLQDEFEAYAANLYDQIGVEEKIFRGYSNSGNRLYSPHTLENVLKEMKKDGIRGGEKFGYGAGSVRAHVTPEFKSLPEIQKNRGRIMPFEDDIKNSANDELIEVLDNLKKFYKYESGSFGYYDNASDELVQLARSGRSESFKPIDEESRKMVADFLNKLANMPTEYFEAKINRGVSLAEFKNALIPSSTSPEIRDILKFNSINTVEYKDNSERAKKLKQLADEKELRFRIIGETGAANLDKAEEATTRLDNLKVAREMEQSGKDVKFIRLATGWEKGVDGKWRYEVPDSKNINPISSLKRKEIEGREYIIDKLNNLVNEPELFKTYPELNDVNVVLYNFEHPDYTSGEYRSKSKSDYFKMDASITLWGIKYSNDRLPESKISTLYHEIQHAIQDYENFSRGGNEDSISKNNRPDNPKWNEWNNEQNQKKIKAYDSIIKTQEYLNERDENNKLFTKEFEPIIDKLDEERNSENNREISDKVQSVFDEFYKVSAQKFPTLAKADEISKGMIYNEPPKKISGRDIYRRLAGEVESRNVQTRMNMNPEERLNTLLSETEDVSREDQIVLMDGLGVSNLEDLSLGEKPNNVNLNSENYKIDLLNSIKFIETGETRIDEDYEPDDAEYNQRKVFIPVYLNSWNYADNTYPNIEPFDNVNEALSDLMKAGDMSEVDRYFTPTKETQLAIKEAWIGSDGEIIEEGKIQSYDDWAYRNKSNEFVKKFGDEGLIESKTFSGREDSARELEQEVYWNISRDLLKSYDGLKLSIQERGKYRTVNVENENGDDVGSIQIRIADHSYNPKNNDDSARSGNFISIEIANKNETKGRFNGSYGIQFDGENTYSEVIEAVNDRIKEIIDRWDIKKELSPANKSNESSIQFDANHNVNADIKDKQNSELTNTILIDGKLRSTVNSNGKPIAATEEGTRNFYAWFKDSKVVDAEGRPLVVYHGTNADFNIFKESTSISADPGIYFTDKESVALRYGKNVRQFYLSINDMVEYDAEGKSYNRAMSDSKFSSEIRHVGKWSDGLALKNIYDHPEGKRIGEKSNVFVVTEPSFIKSATENSGSFSPETNDIRFRIEQERENVNTEPSDAQKEAGNYKMGHIRFDGFDISIENPKGSVRSGVDKQGNEWSQTLPADYGYFRGTVGKDKDHVDVFIGNKPEASNIYIIDQIDPNSGKFDEHKVMLGFDSQAKAKQTYLAAFEPGWKGLGKITKTDKQGLKEWFENGDQKKPFSDNHPQVRYRFAFHGSPHSFDKFSLDKIGTGEGAQAYGWGLYFTDKESISKEYAEKLTRNRLKDMYDSGEDMPSDLYDALDNIGFLGFDNEWQAANVFFKSSKSKVMSNYDVTEKEYDAVNEAYKKDTRNIYTVKIHGDKTLDELNFLRWDKPTSKNQINMIEDQLNKEGIQLTEVDENDNETPFSLKDFNAKGNDVYQNISHQLGSQKAASEFLLRAGIDGIVYPTEYQTKGSHEDAYNYVVFDENAVQIQEHTRFRIAPRDERFDQLREDLNKVSRFRTASENDLLKSVNETVESNMTESHGIKEMSLWERIKRKLNEVKESTQHFKFITEKEFPEVYDKLRQFEAIPDRVKKEAYEKVSQIVRPLIKNEEHMRAFERYIVLSDLVHDIEETSLFANKQLPWGYNTIDEIKQDMRNVRAYVMRTPQVLKAIRDRQAMMKEVKKELVANKLLKDNGNTDYFHHQVLAFMDGKANVGVSAKDVRNHKKGWQRSRQGSIALYNTNYVESEFEVMAQSLEQLAIKNMLGEINESINIMPQLIEKAQKEGGSWRDYIPDGYKFWFPKPGTNAYKAASMAEKAVNNLMNDPNNPELQAILAEAEGSMWVIPEPVAKQLDEMKDPEKEMIYAQGLRAMTNKWKQWTLLNPFRAAKYNFNNMSGDLDIVLAYDPKILEKKYAHSAMTEAWNEMRGKGMSEDMKEALRYGVITSGLSIQEIPDINKESLFRSVTKGQGNWAKRVFGKTLGSYWSGVTAFTQFRENILRVAAYKFFKEQIKQGKQPLGVSNHDAIQALYASKANPNEIAGKLARELMGDYGNLSQGGQWIRAHSYPFWSWVEVNAPRYYRLLQNTKFEGNSGVIGRVAGVGAKKTTVSVGMLGVRVMLMTGLVMLWNQIMFPDEDDELQKYGDDKLKLIVGRREDGSIITIKIQGAFSDVLSFFSLEDLPSDVKELSEGKSTAGKKLAESGNAFVNKFAQGAMPMTRATMELAMGKSLYPDVFDPKSIRDRGKHAARLVSMDKIYNYLTHKPVRSYGKEVSSLLVYDNNPGEAAYYTMREKINEFLKDNDKDTPSTEPSDKSNALYYYKKSLKFGDDKGAQFWFDKYRELGGTAQGYKTSMKKGMLMNAVPKELRGKWLESLDSEDKEILDLGNRWYLETYIKVGIPVDVNKED